MTRTLAILWCMVLLITVRPAGAADQASTFSVASFNVQNLLDVFDDPYTYDESAPPKSRQQIEQLAGALACLDADIVALQEVENEGVLRAMVQEFLPHAGYTYIAVNPTNSMHGMNLAVISRLPIVTITSHRLRELSMPDDRRTWRFARDVMHVRIRITTDKKLDLFNVHFKSRRDSQGDPQSQRWRLAEAAEARQLAQDLLVCTPGAWAVVAGDFNDLPNSASVQLFTEPANALPRWVDAHAHLPADQRVTYLLPPYRSTIDYILVSPALTPRLLADRSLVLRQPDLLGGSDHAPLVAWFSLNPAANP